MSVETHPTSTQPGAAAPIAPAPGPVARIIAGSVAAGIATALVLTLVVFAGGTESVLTGSVLVSFGFGWALLAALTGRYTDRPQRWALVPAAAMGVTGLALLAFTPENDAMVRLAWVWPPVMFALAVWMFVQVRRHLPRRGRVLLAPVVTVLAVASIGATYENITLIRDQDTYAAPGQTYEVGGHQLHLDCHGRGGPTVVLFNGLGEITTHWARIAGPVAETTRVCAYDRAGQGWSTDPQHPQDGIEAAEDLHALLAAAGEAGPYVLAGHSIGGPYAMIYAERYPEQIAGLVLLDSSSPDQFTKVTAYAGQYALMRRGLALMPTLNRLGLARLLPATHLPGTAADQVDALTATARAARNGRDELTTLPDTLAEAQTLTTLGDRPVAVLTASENLSNPGWTDAQDDLAALSTTHVHRTVQSSHMGLLEDADPAAESTRAITEVITAVRTGAHLPAG
jgi:pimeloyl-ACP methyl ester carboxylesterase